MAHQITIAEFAELCNDPVCCMLTVYDANENREIWTGNLKYIPEEVGEKRIAAWDTPKDGHLTINI